MKIWYKGHFAGIAPIWIAEPDSDCPSIEPRGIIGNITLTPVEYLFRAFLSVCDALLPHNEFPFTMSIDRSRTYERPD